MGAPLTFSISLPGQETLAIALSRFSDDIKNFQPFWDDYFRDAWYRSVETHYTTQGGSTGEQWPALSAAYGAWKQKHWPGLPIGVLSGATRESLTFRDDANAIWEATPTSLTVGTRMPYAILLQKGTRRMPARPPLRVSRDFVLLCGKLLQEFGVKAAKDAGIGEAA